MSLAGTNCLVCSASCTLQPDAQRCLVNGKHGGAVRSMVTSCAGARYVCLGPTQQLKLPSNWRAGDWVSGGAVLHPLRWRPLWTHGAAQLLCYSARSFWPAAPLPPAQLHMESFHMPAPEWAYLPRPLLLHTYACEDACVLNACLMCEFP